MKKLVMIFVSSHLILAGVSAFAIWAKADSQAASPVGDQSAINSVAKNEKLAEGEVGSDRLSRVRPVIGTKGMVVSDDAQAAEWGAEILRRGGNAIDAAVATGFMLSVTRPHYGSIGGGGFMVYCPAHQDCTTLDYREKAPQAATRDMFIRNGKADPKLSDYGALASGVPGVTAGLLTALEKYGKLPRKQILSQPIQIAEKGFRRTGWIESAAKERWDAINPAGKEILGCKEFGIAATGPARSHLRRRDPLIIPCEVGTTLVQKDLGKVLREISAKGKEGFYQGWVAEKIVSEIQKAGGVLTAKDLTDYQPQFAKPLIGDFHGMKVVTMPPPSSGGVLLLQMLGYIDRAEKAGLLAEGYGSASTIHVEAHAMALAFADRSQYLGDPDFAKVPVQGLLAKDYLDDRWSTFKKERANSPNAPGIPQKEPSYTTHFSVIDQDGNSVAITTTINDEYGSGFVPSGTGVFMNDEMDDFSSQPGVPNMFGLIGGEANAIAAGKHPLSSMTPTIVRDHDGNTQIVLGAAGGPRIITAVFNILVDHYEFGMSLSDASAAPRVHDQWRPNELRLEHFGFAPEVKKELFELGYDVKESPALAKVHALARFPNGRSWGVPDIRGEGAAIAQ